MVKYLNGFFGRRQSPGELSQLLRSSCRLDSLTDHQQADEARRPLTQQRAAAYSDCSCESLSFLSSPDTRVKPVQTALDSNFHMTTNEGVAIIGSLPIPAATTAASVEKARTFF